MVGVTLSPEQIRSAPPEVRRWLEQQLAATLGINRPSLYGGHAPQELVVCNVEDARAIFSLIRNALPVVSVFFELAREPAIFTQQALRVLHLEDLARHCRLLTPNHLMTCLEAINRALQEASGNPEAKLFALDDAGRCFIPDVTARSIHAVWQEMVAPEAPNGVLPSAGMLKPQFETPYAMSVPPSAISTEPFSQMKE